MKRGNCRLFLAGVVCGGMLFGGGAAWAAGVLAHPSTHRVTVDGIPVDVTAYTIQGNNYFKLRDIAALADFGVTWDGTTSTVEIDTGARYVPEPPEDLYRVREEMVRRTNALRRAEGVAELALDADLMAAAQVRAEEAAASLAYRHQRPDGSSFRSVLRYTGSMCAGENLGMKDTGAPAELARLQVDSWAASDGHRRNLLDPSYQAAGAGIAQDKYGMYYLVQLFAGGDYVIAGVDGPILPGK